MNDRFKFRVWDKENNKMFTPPRHFNYSNVNGTIVCIESFCQYDGFYQKRIIKEFDDAVIMQCTGLKDKNGKLIYEGDIVDKRTYCKWIITWFKNRFILVPDFEYKNKDKCASDRECGFKYFENNHSYADKDIEVIGNIYENKELLNA